jgi:antitoxin component of MazEF toxin-antitoxin module
MATSSLRKVVKLGGSLVITLPMSFTKSARIKAGDELLCLEDHNLTVIKVNKK